MNQRISPRKTIQTRVVFEDEFGDDFLYFISTNISTSGIFVQTSLLLKAGTRVFLKFHLYDEDAPIHVAAEVARQMAKKRGPGRKKPVIPGIGLKFMGLSQADYLRIEGFLAGR